MTTVGIIGVGYLGECLVEGMAPSKTPIVLSPRNAERAARLAKQFGCAVAKDNAEVVAASDVVFLATRPADIVATATGLPWREGQRAISIAAGIDLDAIQAAVGPALAVRSMPIASSRIGASPTAFYPPDALTEEVLSTFGTAHPVQTAEQFETASIFGAYYGWIYAFLDEVSGWAAKNGMDPVAGRELAARMTQSAAAAVIANSDRAPIDLLNDLMTQGGITAAGKRVLDATGALPHWSEALDSAAVRSRQISKGE